MFGGTKGCCAPNGRCKSKTPMPKSSNGECKQIAFDDQKSVDLHIDLPIVAVVKMDLPVRTIDTLERWHDTKPIEPSPPDLQILHSAFLI
jgi:hypothetical protein